MRKPGFYWVLLKNSTAWEIAEWEQIDPEEPGRWWLAGWEIECNNNDIAVIDETKLERKG